MIAIGNRRPDETYWFMMSVALAFGRAFSLSLFREYGSISEALYHQALRDKPLSLVLPSETKGRAGCELITPENDTESRRKL
jgi:hypothetical protein